MFLKLSETAAGQFCAFVALVILPAVVSALKYQYRKSIYGTNIYKGFCLSKVKHFNKLNVEEIEQIRRDFYRRNNGTRVGSK